MSAFIRAAVIGHPIAHSRSPLIHNYWIRHYGLEGAYEAIDIDPAALEARLKDLATEGYSGFNVTVPHKESVMKLCATLDSLAVEIGAVNTVCVRPGGLHGMNTDAYGFIENIRQHAPGFQFAGKTAVILGAGGAARAAIVALRKENIGRIILLNRTRIKAEALVAEIGAGCTVAMEWERRPPILEMADLLVNTTSLGMNGQPSLDIDLAPLPLPAIVNDIVYAPLLTPLLLAAKLRGNPVVTGIGMLLHQARPALQAWFGLMPEVTAELEELILR